MSPTIPRKEQLKVLLTKEEKRTLDALADARGTTTSNLIREFIQSSYDDHVRSTQMEHEILRKLKPGRPTRITDLLDEFSTAIYGLNLADQIGRGLRALVSRSWAAGNPVAGYVLTSAGKRALERT